MKGICSVCHHEFEDGQKAIFGIKVDGQWRFGSSHKPVGDVEVLLASAYCAARWVSQHPECENAILDLLAEGEHQRREKLEKFFECVRHKIRGELRQGNTGGKG